MRHLFDTRAGICANKSISFHRINDAGYLPPSKKTIKKSGTKNRHIGTTRYDILVPRNYQQAIHLD